MSCECADAASTGDHSCTPAECQPGHDSTTRVHNNGKFLQQRCNMKVNCLGNSSTICFDFEENVEPLLRNLVQHLMHHMANENSKDFGSTIIRKFGAIGRAVLIENHGKVLT
jgi:hypothetical protein